MLQNRRPRQSSSIWGLDFETVRNLKVLLGCLFTNSNAAYLIQFNLKTYTLQYIIYCIIFYFEVKNIHPKSQIYNIFILYFVLAFIIIFH